MKPWGSLGVVETIYEDEDADNSSISPSVSPSLLSSPPIPSPCHSGIKAWSSATGQETDVVIHVQGTAFHLHKDPLSSRSSYLRRHLMEKSVLTLSPPLNITVETFAHVVDFCYGTHFLITPFNVVSLLLAAELLGMTEAKGTGDDGYQNLKQLTDGYFRRFIAVNGDYVGVVFKSCLELLPEAEKSAFLVSRCMEAMNFTDDVDGDGHVDGYFDDVVSLGAEDFKIVAESMHRRFEYHDLLYRIIDFYLEEHSGEMAAEQKTQICNAIDCNKLSPQLLLHAVQNPRMPMRFVVRAMLVGQLNTRRSIFSAADHNYSRLHRSINDEDDENNNNISLGAILQREATMRENAKLKAAMDATSLRIQTLEKQVHCMKKILQESDNININGASRDVMESGRSASFHYGSGTTNKIERADRAASFRFSGGREDHQNQMRAFGSSSSENSCSHDQSPNQSPKIRKNIGKRLIKGLKSALGVSNSSTK